MGVDGGSGARLPDADGRLVGADPGWLAARTEADSDARRSTLDHLVPALLDHLGAAGAGEVAVLDVGAGTGANQRWLRPHVPLPQRWVQLDRDPTLARVIPSDPETVLVTGDITVVPGLLNTLPSGRRILTCAALLDVVSADGVRLLCATAAAARAPALFSLTITGAWDLEPVDPLDAPLRRAFDDHQRRGGLAGPGAIRIAVEACRAAGATILTAPTDWHLDVRSGQEFVDRFLRERVAAASEMVPGLSEPARVWLTRRREQLADSDLRIRVGHRDLLALPPKLR
ncbi:MAG TPA: hypothetical protein VIT65_26650 [Microlunatus sp.]